MIAAGIKALADKGIPMAKLYSELKVLGFSNLCMFGGAIIGPYEDAAGERKYGKKK